VSQQGRTEISSRSWAADRIFLVSMDHNNVTGIYLLFIWNVILVTHSYPIERIAIIVCKNVF
jgi:hypothetical protein